MQLRWKSPFDSYEYLDEHCSIGRMSEIRFPSGLNIGSQDQ